MVAELRGVTKRYGQVVALDDLTLRLAPGPVTALLGPNGAGKTTTVKLLLGLARPTSGTVRLFGVMRVLIAEDQSLILGPLAALLNIEADLEVVGQAATGSEALVLAERTRPDVLLTDIEMPGMSGLDLASELRTRGSKAKVILVTTCARPGYLRRALEVGASGYLSEAIGKLGAKNRIEAARLARQKGWL